LEVRRADLLAATARRRIGHLGGPRRHFTTREFTFLLRLLPAELGLGPASDASWRERARPPRESIRCAAARFPLRPRAADPPRGRRPTCTGRAARAARCPARAGGARGCT